MLCYIYIFSIKCILRISPHIQPDRALYKLSMSRSVIKPITSSAKLSLVETKQELGSGDKQLSFSQA